MTPKLKLLFVKPSARQRGRRRFNWRSAQKQATQNVATEKGSDSMCLGRLSDAVSHIAERFLGTCNTSRTKMSLSSADAMKEELRHLIRALKEKLTGKQKTQNAKKLSLAYSCDFLR